MGKSYLYYTIKWRKNNFSKSHKHDQFLNTLDHSEEHAGTSCHSHTTNKQPAFKWKNQQLVEFIIMESPETKMMIEDGTGFCLL